MYEQVTNSVEWIEEKEREKERRKKKSTRNKVILSCLFIDQKRSSWLPFIPYTLQIDLVHLSSSLVLIVIFAISCCKFDGEKKCWILCVLLLVAVLCAIYAIMFVVTVSPPISDKSHISRIAVCVIRVCVCVCGTLVKNYFFLHHCLILSFFLPLTCSHSSKRCQPEPLYSYTLVLGC